MIVREQKQWWEVKVGDVLEVQPGVFTTIAYIEWDATLWDDQGNPWKPLTGTVVVMEPNNQASRDLLAMHMYSHRRRQPIIPVVDRFGRALQ